LHINTFLDKACHGSRPRLFSAQPLHSLAPPALTFTLRARDGVVPADALDIIPGRSVGWRLLMCSLCCCWEEMYRLSTSPPSSLIEFDILPLPFLVPFVLLDAVGLQQVRLRSTTAGNGRCLFSGGSPNRTPRVGDRELQRRMPP